MTYRTYNERHSVHEQIALDVEGEVACPFSREGLAAIWCTVEDRIYVTDRAIRLVGDGIWREIIECET